MHRHLRPTLRHALIALSVAALALPLLAAGPGGGPPSWERFLERHDGDGDGVVTPEELAASGARFAPVDQDGDGVLSEADFLILRDDLIAGGLLHRADDDRDGTLTTAELEAFFAAKDADGNGLLDAADREASAGRGAEGAPGRDRHRHRGHPGHRGERLLDALDTDGDDAVSLAELRALVARADDDGDGVLTADEVPEGGFHGRGHRRGHRGGSR